jgi:hypothetical protein
MTIPGIDVTTAATLVAAIGDIARFPSNRQLVGYCGLDTRIRQSGLTPARRGRISKQGSAAAGHVLVEAAWAAIKTPGCCAHSTGASEPAEGADRDRGRRPQARRADLAAAQQAQLRSQAPITRRPGSFERSSPALEHRGASRSRNPTPTSQDPMGLDFHA